MYQLIRWSSQKAPRTTCAAIIVQEIAQRRSVTMSVGLPDDIDSILMPPPSKRLRDSPTMLEDVIEAKGVTFSIMPARNDEFPAASMVQLLANIDPDEAASSRMIRERSQQHDAVNMRCLPESLNFVTPAKMDMDLDDSVVTAGNRDAKNFDDGDSIQSERTTVIDESNSESNENQAREYDDPMPATTSTRFSDIIGHASVKIRIDEMLLPLALPPALADSILTGVRSLPASLLLYGPPGCGKTQLARAIAGEARAAFVSVGPSDILSKFVGESEASVRSIFRKAYNDAKSMESQCAVLFFDEIDALGHSRGPAGPSSQSSDTDGCSRRVLAELLIQLTLLSTKASDHSRDIVSDHSLGQGSTADFPGRFVDEHEEMPLGDCIPEELAKADFIKLNNSSLQSADTYNSFRPSSKVRVIVVAATNRPEDCDPALLRRFSIRVNVDLPSNRDRRKIIAKFLGEFDHTITKAQLKDLAEATEGWSGCDLESLTREAAMAPIRECLRSAAMLKRRARKMEQQGGDDSSQGLKRTVDADEEARDTLLKDFRSLRPVTLEDFEDAVEFWLGNQQTPSITGAIQPKRKHAHYDSTSSSDDEDS